MSSAADPNLHQLSAPPSDGVSSVRFSRVSDNLVSASWDKGVRVHNANPAVNALLAKFEHESAALDACFGDDDARTFSTGLDRRILAHDVATGACTQLGTHEKAARCIEWSTELGLVVSGSWDKTVQFWDPRAAGSSSSSSSSSIAMCAQPGKVFALAISGYRLVVGTSERHVQVYDVRNTAQPEQRRVSSLKHQTRAIRIAPDQQGFVMSSIEGRVAVEYFDMSPAQQARKYAFKCHRTTVNETQYVFPVNALAFHPVFGTFATGGCDSLVAVWDGEQKKRVTQFAAFPTSIAALDFNRDGSLLAVASSYTYEEGEKDHPADNVFIRQVQESEVRPKIKAK